MKKKWSLTISFIYNTHMILKNEVIYQMNKEMAKSYLMVIAAMLIWGSSGVLRRNIPVSSEFLAFIRGILGALFMLAIILYNKNTGLSKIPAKVVGTLLVTGAMYGLNWIFFFEAINYTTVPVATLCYYMQPTIVILLSPLLLKERLTIKKIIVVILTATGMVLISGITENSSLGENQLKGILFGLSAGFLYALNAILNKRISQIDTYHKTFIQLIGATIIMLPYPLLTNNFFPTEINIHIGLLIFILGTVYTGVAFALYFASMKKLSASSVAICSYIDPISALFLSALLLGETLTITGIAGAILIIGTALISEIK